MPDLFKRTSGGQPGNQNARKHGFYSKALTKEEKRQLKYASEVEGLDQEIAVIRVKFNSLVAAEGNHQMLINQTAATLVKLCHFKTGLALDDTANLKQALSSILEEFPVSQTDPNAAQGPSAT